ncbi:hypothetical protein [Hymenobacter sp.]|uniref:hypothetical protein n=1 Tax=Hymenobacter sp. TaxID=1898978 RepID=UPI00286D5A92|nr:hypothetical protein [Hymenobacter sp.]
MPYRYLFLALGFLLQLADRRPLYAQGVGIGTTTPAAAAALDIRASDKGLLIPRLTAAQRTGIAAPPQGLMVYQTDGTAGGGPGTGFWYFGGNPAAWVFINPAGGGADNLGNHTATTNLSLGANALTGTGASIGAAVGVGVRADGGLNIGQNGVGNNVFVGYQAGAVTTGGNNQFVGYQAGAANTTGIRNQFVGYQSGLRNTTGEQNQFSGFFSGFTNTTGDQNQFSGFESGRSNTTGNRNQFSGFRSGYSNTTSSGNYFSGFTSGYFNTEGSNNYFSGHESGLSNTEGAFNQFTGNRSGYSNRTGNFNQFDGYRSGYDNTTGSQNHFSGYQSGTNNTMGRGNTFSGQNSGLANTTGNENTFSGYLSGRYNTTGSDNTALGSNSGPANGSGAISNATALGANVSLTTSNTLVLGNNANVGIGTSAPLTKLSLTPTALEPKITLFDNGRALSHHGFGVSNGQLNYHVLNLGDSHVFYIGGKNGDGAEILRIQGNGRGNGRVGIGTSSPQNELDVAGTARVEEVNTPRTGAANMLPVAYGRLDRNGATVTGSGNFISRRTDNDLYTIEFTTASQLSSFDFTNAVVVVTPIDYVSSPLTYTDLAGQVRVVFYEGGIFGGLVPTAFSFVIYVP